MNQAGARQLVGARAGQSRRSSGRVVSGHHRRLLAASLGKGEVVTRNVIVNSNFPPYVQKISIGPHHLLADEPSEAGGADAGPNPYELVMAALGACTSMTVRMYAERRNWPLEKVHVDLTFSRFHAADCDDCSRKKGIVNRITKRTTFIGDLSEIQRQRLMHIANKCPVHRVLARTIEISSTLNSGSMSAASAEV